MRAHNAILLLGAALLVSYIALAIGGPMLFERSGQSLLYLTLYFVCLSVAWNLFSGFSGYVNFGFVAFIGIGMYAAVIAIVDLKVAPVLGYLIGGCASAAFAAVIGYPLLRIRGAYFSIAMLSVAEGVRILVSTDYLEPFTRGGSGIAVPAGSFSQQYVSMLILTAIVIAVSAIVAQSRLGLSLISIREDEAAADGLGVNTTVVKIAAFVLSAFFAGAAGGIHATFVHYIDPQAAFDIKFTILPIIMAIFGGLGTVLGPVIGGIVLELISDTSWLYLGRMSMTVFGLILVALILWLPDGVIVRLKEAGRLPRTRIL
jgi:branched-chain amino acid transport system permease protein